MPHMPHVSHMPHMPRLDRVMLPLFGMWDVAGVPRGLDPRCRYHA
jgi:hypothetical protein